MIFKQAQEKITDIILHLTHDLKASLIEVEESDYEGNSYTQKFNNALTWFSKLNHLNTGLFCDIENQPFLQESSKRNVTTESWSSQSRTFSDNYEIGWNG